MLASPLIMWQVPWLIKHTYKLMMIQTQSSLIAAADCELFATTAVDKVENSLIL